MTTYITDAADIQQVRAGVGRINGKEILLADADMKTATKRIFYALSKHPNVLAKKPTLALVPGLGLCIKNSANQWVRIPVPELKKLVLDSFVLVREQTNANGSRLEVLTDVPNPFWLPTLLQGRWLDNTVESWFPVTTRQEKVKVITKP